MLFINPSGAATRECSWDGTWKSNPNYNSTSGWTNYSACVPPKPIVNPPDFTVCWCFGAHLQMLRHWYQCCFWMYNAYLI